MKKLLLFLSLVLLLSSCDSLTGRTKHHKISDDSEESASSDKKSESDEAVEDYNESDPTRNYYGESHGKNAEIEQWITVVSKRYLTESDIENVPTEDLSLIRNLIFANHNYRFKESRFFYFFSKYDWYQPLYDDPAQASRYFNKFETYNVNFLKNHEKR